MADIILELQKIHNYEKTLKKVSLNSSSLFEVGINGGLKMEVDGDTYKAEIKRPLIHQIGNRLWQQKENDFNAINSMWNQKHKEGKDLLAREVKEKLKEKKAVLLLDSNKKKIYGIVSEQFTEINPLDFRTKFIDSYKTYGTPKDYEKKIGYTRYGEPIEKYSYRDEKVLKGEEPVEIELQIIYGLNNGYSSYRIRLGRTILVCSNGLTIFEGKLAQLKHTKDLNISEFIKHIERDIYGYSEKLQQMIRNAKNRSISDESFNELFRRLHVSNIVKTRVKERFEVERNTSGDNEWSLSQAFTYTASHIYKLNRDSYHENILTEVGSDILDNSIPYVLGLTVKEEPYGELKTYGNLLPKDFRSIFY